MNEILAHRQLQIASRDEILAAFGLGLPFRTREFFGSWDVLGPMNTPGDYPLTWSPDRGMEAQIATGLTQEHAALFTEILNAAHQVERES